MPIATRRNCLAPGVVLAGSLAVSACTTLGPDYEEPDVEWLGEWQTDLYGQLGNPEAQTETDLRFWWRLFDDEVLNELIETAREQNPTLRIAGLRILESRAVLGIARSSLYPQLNQANASAAYVAEWEEGGSETSLGSYQASYDTAWELDFWGRFRRGIESADAAFLGSITAQQDVQVLLSAEIADLYFAYRTTKQRIDIAERNAALQKRSFEITDAIFRAGQGAELDLQQAKTQYLATLATIPGFEATLVQIRNALAALLGRPPGELPELSSLPASLPTVEPVVVSEIPARLLLRRPDVRTAAWQIAAQSAQIGIAQADFYPAITLFGSIGWSSDSLDETSDTVSLVAGPSLAWNVFDFGRIRNNVRLQDARLQQAIEAFQNTVLQAARQIDDAAVSVVAAGEQQVLFDDALVAAERSLQLANTRYQEGYSDFQRVLDAQRVLFAQEELALLNHGGHLSAVVALYRAIGGGWRDMPIDEIVPEPLREEMRDRTNWGELIDAPLPPTEAEPAL